VLEAEGAAGGDLLDQEVAGVLLRGQHPGIGPGGVMVPGAGRLPAECLVEPLLIVLGPKAIVYSVGTDQGRPGHSTGQVYPLTTVLSEERMHQPGRGRRWPSGWHHRSVSGRFSETRRALQVMRGRYDRARRYRLFPLESLCDRFS
jgi:hypothetical protein